MGKSAVDLRRFAESMESEKPMRNEISATDCMREGWSLIKDDYLVMLGASTLGMLLLYILPIIFQGPVYCGLFILMFDRMRGRAVSFERFFDGFNHFLTALLVTLITVIPGFILLFLVLSAAIVLIVSGVAFDEQGVSGALAGSIGLAVIITLAGLLISISFQIMMAFAIPLVVEEKLGAVEACKKSARAVINHLGLVGGLVAFQSLLAIAGTLACFIGIIFVIPLIFASSAVAYRHIFGLHSTHHGAII